MASATSALVEASLSRAASLMGDFLPIFGLAVALAVVGSLGYMLRGWFSG